MELNVNVIIMRIIFNIPSRIISFYVMIYIHTIRWFNLFLRYGFRYPMPLLTHCVALYNQTLLITVTNVSQD